ncbi:MAG: hypothetical protein RIE24_13780 [Silicimonas sp.]
MGYDRPEPGSQKLRANAKESEIVRCIFWTYPELGSVYELERHLREEGSRLSQGGTAAPDPAERTLCRIVLPLRFAIRGGRTEVIGGAPGQANRDPVLIRALREAHSMVGKDRSGDPVLETSPVTPHRRKLVRLAFIAPDIQRAILSGKQPHDLSLARILECDLPLAWGDQRQVLGFARESLIT